MFYQKKYYPLVYEFLQNFKIPLFIRKTKYSIRIGIITKKIGIITKKIGMIGYRIPPTDQEDHFFDRNEKIMINP